eukprot:SAG11_NODE_9817_length_878_cov_2.744544_1_plen_148_part_00
MKVAFIRGELIRYVKRSSDAVYYDATRAAFRRRLKARGYPNAFLDRTFGLIDYADRWRYLRLTNSIRTRAAEDLVARADTDPDTSPALLALTLPHTQRVTAMRAHQALFPPSERSLRENIQVPMSIRSTNFRLAMKMGRKLGSTLLE